MLGYNYYISVVIFVLCITAAAVKLLCSVISRKPVKGKTALFVSYEFAFAVNMFLCMGESVYVGEYFNTVADGFAFSLAQLAVCLFSYITVCAESVSGTESRTEKGRTHHMPVMEKTDERAAHASEITERAKRSIIDVCDDLFDGNDSAGSEEKEINDKPKSMEAIDKLLSADSRLPDVNVAYVSDLLTALLSKNLQPEEREKAEALKIRLKSLPATEEGKRELNAMLGFLLKKIAEYNIPA